MHCVTGMREPCDTPTFGSISRDIVPAEGQFQTIRMRILQQITNTAAAMHAFIKFISSLAASEKFA
jgi:hypothetical protein